MPGSRATRFPLGIEPLRIRRSRPSTIALFGIGAVCALLALPPPASAHHTFTTFRPPFIGFGHYLKTFGGPSYNCGTNRTLSPSPTFNLTSGKLRFSMAATAGIGANCTSATYSDGLEQAAMDLVSPNITVSTGGTYVLRTNWWFEWWYNVTESTAATSRHQYTQSHGDIQILMQLYDATTNTWGTQTIVLWNSTFVDGSNGTFRYHRNAWQTLPISAVLSNGDKYVLYLSLTAQVSADTGPGANKVRASLAFGTDGNGTSLLAVKVR